MRKEICFISSPGNGLSSCCCCCRPDYPIRRGRHRKWKEAPEPNPHPMRAVETERRWKNSRVGSTSAFEGTTKCEGWEKQKASLPSLDDKCLEATRRP